MDFRNLGIPTVPALLLPSCVTNSPQMLHMSTHIIAHARMPDFIATQPILQLYAGAEQEVRQPCYSRVQMYRHFDSKVADVLESRIY